MAALAVLAVIAGIAYSGRVSPQADTAAINVDVPVTVSASQDPHSADLPAPGPDHRLSTGSPTGPATTVYVGPVTLAGLLGPLQDAAVSDLGYVAVVGMARTGEAPAVCSTFTRMVTSFPSVPPPWFTLDQRSDVAELSGLTLEFIDAEAVLGEAAQLCSSGDTNAGLGMVNGRALISAAVANLNGFVASPDWAG